MSDLFLLATAAAIGLSMFWAYRLTRDALHPLMYIGPMLFYQYVLCPWTLFQSETLSQFFPDDSMLDTVLLLNLLGVGLFCLGCVRGVDRAKGTTLLGGDWHLSPTARQRLFQLACVLGSIAVATSTYLLIEAGGISVAFGRAKGGLRASSGYFTEAALLSYPAILLLAVARRGRRLGWSDAAILLAFAFPHLLTGILGTRRGPLFQVLATLGMAYCIWRFQRVRLSRLLGGVAAIGIAVFFVFAHRSEIYVGSDFELDLATVWERALPRAAELGNDFVVSSGTVVMCRETGRHYWGERMLVTFVVRPIPRQLWPTKYADLGFGWMTNQPGTAGIPRAEWKATLGWDPYLGSAGGFISDLFLEFSWGSLVFCYLFGSFFRLMWQKASLAKGLWTVLYLEAAALSIYVPTQSVSAVLHRFLIMAFGTAVLWTVMVGPLLARARRRSADRWVAYGRAAPVGPPAVSRRSQRATHA